jgi:CyaY protein
MTDREFLELCERVFAAIEDALDDAGADVETVRAGPLLELEFDDGSKIVVNGNQHLKELWVAARSGGFHFRREGELWVDTRTGDEFFASLSRMVGEQAGTPVAIRG